MPHSENQRSPLPQLIKRLAGDGVRVAEGEMNLAVQELKQIIRSYVVGFAIGAASIAVMTVAIAVLAQAAAMALIPYLGSASYAYLTVGSILMTTTIGMILIARRCFTKKHEPIGLIFRWLNRSVKTE